MRIVINVVAWWAGNVCAEDVVDDGGGGGRGCVMKEEEAESRECLRIGEEQRKPPTST